MTRLVCENHPDKAWPDECECGAGMPEPEYRWITLENGRSVYRKAPAARGPSSDLARPMLARDQMDPLWHPSDGKHYESKAEFRRATRQAGALEVGSDKLDVSPPTLAECSRDDVGEAIRKVSEGYKPSLDAGAEGWS